MKLLPGDALLYAPSSIYGRLIAVKTGHSLSHVEVALGDGRSVASRDGVGTGIYPVRLSQLELVCRPKQQPVDVSRGLAWLKQIGHRPYGWLDLLWFFDYPIPKWMSSGIVCSPFADEFLMACDVDLFNTREEPQRIAPYEFSVTPLVDALPTAGELISV